MSSPTRFSCRANSPLSPKRRTIPGRDFVANNGLAGLLVGFVFKPPIVELTRSPVPTVSWTITASVTVRAGGLASDTKSLSVPVELGQLEIPKFIALFRHKNFAAFEDPDTPGFVLMLIPHHSILQGISEPLNDLLDRIHEALRPLRSLVGIAAFLTGIDTLKQALASQPLVRVKRGSEDNLEDIHMRVDKFLGSTWLEKDLRPNDRVSALILMGPCGTRVGCFDDEDFTTEHGEWGFHVRTGPEMVTIISDLSDGKPPPTFPEEDPNDPRSQRLFILRRGGASFADNMTSVLFDPEPSDQEKELPDPCLAVEVPGSGGPIL
ncbi:MAG TPA: hypothetical protein VF517_14610 [Thermoleophilaceae bacterium]